MTEAAHPDRSTGRVASFDSHRGLGSIESDGSTIEFHCVEIADGSRDIEVGVTVAFDLLPKFGRYEAANICPAG